MILLGCWLHYGGLGPKKQGFREEGIANPAYRPFSLQDPPGTSKSPQNRPRGLPKRPLELRKGPLGAPRSSPGDPKSPPQSTPRDHQVAPEASGGVAGAFQASFWSSRALFWSYFGDMLDPRASLLDLGSTSPKSFSRVLDFCVLQTPSGAIRGPVGELRGRVLKCIVN